MKPEDWPVSGSMMCLGVISDAAGRELECGVIIAARTLGQFQELLAAHLRQVKHDAHPAVTASLQWWRATDSHI